MAKGGDFHMAIDSVIFGSGRDAHPFAPTDLASLISRR
jgi:hypothetical protein